MKKMGSSKAPKTPDYTGAAIEQGRQDQQIAQYLTNANRPNQIDPYGQVTWNQEESPEYLNAKAELANYQQSVANHPEWAPDLIAQDMAKIQAKVDAAKGNGKWTQTTTYTPEQQKMLEQQQQLQGMQNSRIQELLASVQTPSV